MPEDEFDPSFPGYSKDEVNIESRSFQCRTRVCLVANFQGRVSCKYGQEQPNSEGNLDPAGHCMTPDLTRGVAQPVLPQLEERRAQDAVYCSCRCAGPQANAPYCECPDGFECQELLADIDLGDRQLAGSYCVRAGTYVEDPGSIAEINCDLATQSCGEPGTLD